jgi:hypothetical protein
MEKYNDYFEVKGNCFLELTATLSVSIRKNTDSKTAARGRKQKVSLLM